MKAKCVIGKSRVRLFFDGIEVNGLQEVYPVKDEKTGEYIIDLKVKADEFEVEFTEARNA